MLVETRVIEVCPGEWVAQYAGGLDGWTTFSDAFDTQQEAEDWLQDQINNADLG